MTRNNDKLIGKVSATEKMPTTCDEFQFWLSDKILISPFDIVKVKNSLDNSITYGVIQDICHITDSYGHISNFVSSDFGNVNAKPMTKRLAVSYAKVSVIHNTNENYMPLKDSELVYMADDEDIKVALGLDCIDNNSTIPAGLLKTSDNVKVPIPFNGDFLIGPEGAHLNISGISGLATKTSYIMFLLKAIQHKKQDDVAFIILNVKGDDLLNIDVKNSKITDEIKKDWLELGLPCEEFHNVKYFYPYCSNKSHFCANTSLPNEDLKRQFNKEKANNFVYTYDHDISKLEMLFTNIDDPNWTIESILNFIETNNEFTNLVNWEEFNEKLKDFVASGRTGNKDIPVQSWRRFSRLVKNSINDELFVDTISSNKKERHQVYLSNEILNINGGEVFVVDIANLSEQLQCMVFGDVIRTVYELKHGDYADSMRGLNRKPPKKIIIFVDELNKYAPNTSVKGSPLLTNLLDVTERGRSEGIILFSAEQFRSGIHDRIKGNCGTNIYGRTNAIEISKPDYKFIPTVYANMMTRLGKGDLIIQHPVFKTLLKISFPYPAYNQGGVR